MIKVKDLTIGYENKIIISNIDLNFNKNEVVLLLGSNGIGKSTFLKTLSGLIPEKAGHIDIDSKKHSSYSNLELSRLISVCFSSQDVSMFLSVKEFLKMGRYPYVNIWGHLGGIDKEVINRYVERMNLTELLDSPLGQISDGQRQRVFLARTLIQETPIILLDEPLIHLDIGQKIQFINVLKQEQGKIIIISGHELGIYKNILTRILGFSHDKSLFEIQVDSIDEKDLERLFLNTNSLDISQF